MFDVALDGALKGPFFSAIEEILRVHLKAHLKAYFKIYKNIHIEHKSAQKNSIKRWTWGGTLCYAWERTYYFTLRSTKNWKKIEEKVAFDVEVDGPVDDLIKDAHLNLNLGSLCVIHIL